ncbi:DUF6737 family protein [Prochlorothrix hollandica]|uniref:DUF6737 family protein n=1 Tax=Prochlorothrix hollandica TaxID=1223 RepID=UPI000348BADA|nr:DUF6737 family protein [Prochlorothrix hollandica]
MAPVQPPVNVWAYKPWWCQPWSILATGWGAIAASWWLFHRYWLTIVVALPLLAWMVFFVILWPRLMQSSGLLDQLAANPVTANPVTANPVTANPVTANPVTANPVTANPSTRNPETLDPETVENAESEEI